MKSTKSKKRMVVNIVSILTLLFLSLGAAETIIRTPAIVSGFAGGVY